ncbi:MAG TPA: hypothetical protein DGT23_04450 [Micromonosporaceae bacterium]|nr:hypothetical protein [Micromonosporaceae bacterium]
MSERASIDDLFSGEERSADPPRKSPQAQLLSLLLIATVLAGIAFVGLRIAELTAPLPMLFAVAVTIVLGLRMVRGLRPPPRSRQAGRHHEERVTVADGLQLAISRWDTMLDWCHTDVSRFNRRVLPKLGELVDERLRQRHGITRVSDPEQARAVLGDPLWTYVTMPLRRPPHPRELDQIVTALEKL